MIGHYTTGLLTAFEAPVRLANPADLLTTTGLHVSLVAPCTSKTLRVFSPPERSLCLRSKPRLTTFGETPRDFTSVYRGIALERFETRPFVPRPPEIKKTWPTNGQHPGNHRRGWPMERSQRPFSSLRSPSSTVAKSMSRRRRSCSVPDRPWASSCSPVDRKSVV